MEKENVWKRKNGKMHGEEYWLIDEYVDALNFKTINPKGGLEYEWIILQAIRTIIEARNKETIGKRKRRWISITSKWYFTIPKSIFVQNPIPAFADTLFHYRKVRILGCKKITRIYGTYVR